MSKNRVFVIDANVFIQASRLYYAFDLAPRFWDELVTPGGNGRVLSIDKVAAELEWPEELTNWARGDFADVFQPVEDDDVLRCYGQLMAWSQGQEQYSQAAKAEFADMGVADAWLVAYAMAKGCTVVTQEQPAPEAKRKIPIPGACEAFNVDYRDTFEMMRELQIRFN